MNTKQLFTSKANERNELLNVGLEVKIIDMAIRWGAGIA
jgi:hypothetical protein